MKPQSKEFYKDYSEDVSANLRVIGKRAAGVLP